METPAEKPATAPGVTVEDLREFRRTAWRNVLGWQLLVDAVCVSLGVSITDGWSGIVAMSIVLHIPIIVLVLLPKLRWAVKAKLDEAATNAAAAEKRYEARISKARNRAGQRRLWRALYDGAGVVRIAQAAVAFVVGTSVVIVLLLLFRVNQDFAYLVFLSGAVFWFMTNLARERDLIRLALTADRFPEHAEIQLVHRLQVQHPRFEKIAWSFAIMIAAFVAVTCLRWGVAVILAPSMLLSTLLPFVTATRNESIAERRARLVRLILDMSSPAYSGAGQWWLTDWGRVRPVIFVGSALAFAAFHLWFKIKLDISSPPHAIQIFVAFWWIYFSFSCLYPFAYWKMLAARSGADATVQPAMTEPRP